MRFRYSFFILLSILLYSSAYSFAQETASDSDLPPAVLGSAPALRGEPVNYFPEDPTASGYIVTPDSKGKKPALIIVHEWYGLKLRIKEMADALADEGYVVLAADMYSGKTGSNSAENRALVKESLSNPDYIIRNLDAAANYLRSRDDVIGDKIGTMGWCYGGGVVLSYGIGGKHHEATAIFYGSLIDDPEKLKHIGHEVLGLFGEKDSGIPPSKVRKFEKALRTAGIENEIHIYDDVGHGFFLWVDKRPETKKSATDAWAQLKDYLNRTLGN